jgi:hypothetical protein
MRIPEREGRDLLLLGAIVLLGVFLMFLSGQFAIRMLPRWNVPSDMQSNIDPNLRLDSGSDALASVGLAPLRPEIQTPPAWQRTFLTPQANLDLLNEVPVVVVAPVTSQPTWTATQAAAPTEIQPPTATATLLLTPTPFPTNTMVYVFPTWTFTPKPPEPTFTPTFTSTFTPTHTPTLTLTPSLTFTPTYTPTNTPVPTLTFTPVTPAPWPWQIGTTPNNNYLPLGTGEYLTIGITFNVNGNPGPDLIFYERPMSPGIHMDQIIIWISQTGHPEDWIEIFNWGDNEPDSHVNPNMNTPGIVTDVESDNYQIPAAYLVLGTGFAIDLDLLTPEHLPRGTYNYIHFYAPPGDSGDGADINAIQPLP